MFKAKTDTRTFEILDGDLGDAHAYIENLLARRGVNDETSNETLLVFDSLMRKLLDWGLDEGVQLKVVAVERLGDFRIRVGFEGEVFAREAVSAKSAEDRVLDECDDRLAYSYHSGYNEISISVNRGRSTSVLACAVAALCAVVVYIPLSILLDAREQQDLFVNYVFPLETLYGNAMLMVGAPMTFFSLLKNLTDTYVVSRRNSGLRGLQARTLATSVLAMLLAFAVFFAESLALTSFKGFSSSFGGSSSRTFADVITSLVPPPASSSLSRPYRPSRSWLWPFCAPMRCARRASTSTP